MTELEQSPILHKGILKVPQTDFYGTNTAEELTKMKQNYHLSALCVLFGMGTWMPVNSIYTQLPTLTEQAPEQWNLASYFTLLVQFGNIAPFLYYSTYFILKRELRAFESLLICIFLIIGTVSIFAIAFFYNHTLVVFGQSHSVLFFIFSFFISMLGCISSVLFIPFMYKLPEIYLVPFFIGEGLSGLLPSSLAIFQGVGKKVCESGKEKYIDPVFNTTTFLCIIGCFMLLSSLSFVYLNYFSNFVNNLELHFDTQRNSPNNLVENHVNPSSQSSSNLSMNIILLLLVTQTLTNCFSNGVLPAIQSFSCLPYGSEAYHWTVLLNQITNPIVIYMAFFLPVLSMQVLRVSVAALILCIGYEIITAFMSPNPPMVQEFHGAVVIVTVWMTGSALISYVKLSIASIFRSGSKEGLINYGLFTQIGSAVGAVISFLMVNYWKWFESIKSNECS